MALETLANQILALVNWGITIIVLMLIWEMYQFIRGGAEAGPLLSPGSTDRLWKGVKARIPGTARYARRVQQRELNEYVLEENEEKYLDSLKGQALHVLSELEAVASQKSFSHYQQSSLVREILRLGQLLNDQKRYFRNLNRRTARTENSLEKLFDYFKKKGISVPQEVLDLEKHIMVLHQQTGDEIAKVEDLYATIVAGSEAMKKLESMTPEMFAGALYKIETKSEPFNLEHLYYLISAFRNETFLLEDAYKRQAEAKKEMQGIISETRGLYE